MEELIKFKKDLTKQMLMTTAAVSAGFVLLGYIPAAKGFVLGSLCSVINFRLMVRQAPRRLGRERKSATWHSFSGLTLRLLILALPLYAAFRSPGVDIIWAAVGIFNLQLSVLIYNFFKGQSKVIDGSTTEGR